MEPVPQEKNNPERKKRIGIVKVSNISNKKVLRLVRQQKNKSGSTGHLLVQQTVVLLYRRPFQYSRECQVSSSIRFMFMGYYKLN